MMKKSTSEIKYRWALWVGLALAVGGLAASWLFFGDNQNMDASFDRLTPRWMNALLICLVGPLLEESAFRLWATGRRWCGIVSLLLATAYVWSVTNLWWAALPVAAAMALCLFVLRNPKVRDIILMLLTSVLFAAAHSGNFIDVDLDAVLVMLSDFGFGLLACYLVFNHGFLWAVLLHVANNTVAVAALAIVTATWSATVSTDRYELTLRYGDEFEHSQRGDTLVYCEPLTAFAYNLAWNQQHTDSIDNPLLFHYYDIGRSNKSNYYRMTVVDRRFGTKSDYSPLLEAMRDSNLIHIDTLRLPALRLVVEDSALLMQHAFTGPFEEHPGVNLAEVENACRDRLRIPLIRQQRLDDTLYVSDFEEFGRMAYTNTPDSAALMQWLPTRGLRLVPSPGDTMTIVQFR